jgi:hypothetical protein
MINHSMIIGMAIDEFAEDGAQLICGHNKANSHTQNAGALTGQCTPLDPHLIFLKTPCILSHYGPEVAQIPESARRLN